MERRNLNRTGAGFWTDTLKCLEIKMGARISQSVGMPGHMTCCDYEVVCDGRSCDTPHERHEESPFLIILTTVWLSQRTDAFAAWNVVVLGGGRKGNLVLEQY